MPDPLAAAMRAAAAAVPFTNRDAMRRIIEAAAPHLAAAEPVRMMPDLTAAERAELEERFRAAQRAGKITVLADDTDQRIAEAVAAEREACAQLALAEAAQMRDEARAESEPGDELRCISADILVSFAALLREEANDGT